MIQSLSQSPFGTASILEEPQTITISSNGLTINGKSMITFPKIKKVIFQKQHTIVLWEDGKKTVVRAFNEEFDKEKGLAMAIAKRYTTRSEFNRLIENADIQNV